MGPLAQAALMEKLHSELQEVADFAETGNFPLAWQFIERAEDTLDEIERLSNIAASQIINDYDTRRM